MKILAVLKKQSILLTINGEPVSIKIPSDYYLKKKGTSSYNMFLDPHPNETIKSAITRQRDKLSFASKLQYIFFRNAVHITLDDDVRQLLTDELINAYATLLLDARNVYIQTNRITNEK